jgi:hypothetical protein
MLDIEYISELATGLLFGPQNKKARLDDYYANFEQEFPDRERAKEAFNAIIAELVSLWTWPTRLRWSRKVDFYTLFLVLGGRVDEMPFDREGRQIVRERLGEFSEMVSNVLRMTDQDRDSSGDSAAVLAYARGVRNSSDLNSRRMRSAALDAFVRGIKYEGSNQHAASPLSSLPSTQELMSLSGDNDTSEEQSDEE